MHTCKYSGSGSHRAMQVAGARHLEQGPQGQQLCKNAAGCPQVHSARVVPGAQQQLRGAVPVHWAQECAHFLAWVRGASPQRAHACMYTSMRTHAPACKQTHACDSSTSAHMLPCLSVCVWMRPYLPVSCPPRGIHASELCKNNHASEISFSSFHAF